MNERRTSLQSLWRSVTLIVLAGCILSSPPVTFVVGVVLADPVGALFFFSAFGASAAALVIRLVVRSVNRHDDPRTVHLPDEGPSLKEPAANRSTGEAQSG